MVVVLALGSGSAQQQDNCVDISKFGPVRYNETASEMCDYELVTRLPQVVSCLLIVTLPLLAGARSRSARCVRRLELQTNLREDFTIMEKAADTDTTVMGGSVCIESTLVGIGACSVIMRSSRTFV